jgi:hypothetical protein
LQRLDFLNACSGGAKIVDPGTEHARSTRYGIALTRLNRIKE